MPKDSVENTYYQRALAMLQKWYSKGKIPVTHEDLKGTSLRDDPKHTDLRVLIIDLCAASNIYDKQSQSVRAKVSDILAVCKTHTDPDEVRALLEPKTPANKLK